MKRRVLLEKLDARQMFDASGEVFSPVVTEPGNATVDTSSYEGSPAVLGQLILTEAPEFTLFPGRTVVSGIDSPGGEQTYVMQVTEGTRYVFETTAGSLRDTTLTLYEQDGRTQIAFDDDGGVGFASRIEWTAQLDGLVILKARAYSRYSTGDFTLSVSSENEVATEAPVIQGTLAGHSATSAVAIAGNDLIQGAVDGPGSQAWYVIDATEGVTYTFETVAGSLRDTTLRLYDSSGERQLRFDDDGGAAFASRIEWTATDDGPTYVVVGGYGSLSGSFGLNVSERATANTDDHANRRAGATVITTDEIAQGEIEIGGDEDWFQFEASEGGSYVLETILESLRDTTLALYGTDGTSQLVFNDDGGQGLASRIEWTAPATGSYFLKVEAYSGYQTGSYTLSVTSNNTAPFAQPDAYTVDEDTTLEISVDNGVLANDSDDQGDSLAATITSQSAHGTVTLQADGSFVYTPNSNYHGDDSFSYTVSDGTLQSDPVTVGLVVNSVNDAPNLRPDSVGITQGTTIHRVPLNPSDPDGDSLRITAAVKPADAPVSVTVDGTSLVYTIAPFFVGEFDTTVHVSDGSTEIVHSFATTSSFVIDTDGVLTIQGTENRDAVAVELAGETIFVRSAFNYHPESSDGTTTTYPASAVTSVLFHGNEGDDTFSVSGALETIARGGAGNDVFFGGSGVDEFYGGGGADELYGNSGNDLLFGDEGMDTLTGGLGDDEIHGGSGDDLLIGENTENDEANANDSFFTGLGIDTVVGRADVAQQGEGTLGSPLQTLSLVDPIEGATQVKFRTSSGSNVPANYQNLVDRALDIWSQSISSRYADETVVVDIQWENVPVYETDAAGDLKRDSEGHPIPEYQKDSAGNFVLDLAGNKIPVPDLGNLASAGPTGWEWANQNYRNPQSLANHTSGIDLNGEEPEIDVTVNNHNYSSTAATIRDDFLSTLVHEIGHGLGFSSGYDASGERDSETVDYCTGGIDFGWIHVADTYCSNRTWFFDTVYDQFIVDGDGNPMAALTNAERADAFQGSRNGLFWSGENGAAANAGLQPALYAPSSYEAGSSISHLDETIHGDHLMSPSNDDVMVAPGAIDLGLLEDMGWNIDRAARPVNDPHFNEWRDAFQTAHDTAVRNGNASGYPMFASDGLVVGTIQWNATEVSFRPNQSAANAGGANSSNVGERFRQTHTQATAAGFSGAFPNLHEALDPSLSSTDKRIFGVTRFRSAMASVGQASYAELGRPQNAMDLFYGVQQYAQRQGFATGIPTFHTDIVDGELNYELIFVRAAPLIDTASILFPGERLIRGQNVASPDGRFELHMQSDGNLVLYNTSTGAALWASNTDGRTVTKAVMEHDGRLTLFNGDQEVWSTVERGAYGSYMRVENTGRLVIYTPSNTVLWSHDQGRPSVAAARVLMEQVLGQIDYQATVNGERDHYGHWSNRYGDQILNHGISDGDLRTLVMRDHAEKAIPHMMTQVLGDVDHETLTPGFYRHLYGNFRDDWINLARDHSYDDVLGDMVLVRAAAERHASAHRALVSLGHITLQANNGRYVVAEQGGGREVLADRNAIGPWEGFRVIDLGNNRVALQTANGNYLTAEDAGNREITARQTVMEDWEAFEVLWVGEGQIALRTHHGQLVAANGGSSPLNATTEAINAATTFTFALYEATDISESVAEARTQMEFVLGAVDYEATFRGQAAYFGHTANRYAADIRNGMSVEDLRTQIVREHADPAIRHMMIQVFGNVDHEALAPGFNGHRYGNFRDDWINQAASDSHAGVIRTMHRVRVDIEREVAAQRQANATARSQMQHVLGAINYEATVNGQAAYYGHWSNRYAVDLRNGLSIADLRTRIMRDHVHRAIPHMMRQVLGNVNHESLVPGFYRHLYGNFRDDWIGRAADDSHAGVIGEMSRIKAEAARHANAHRTLVGLGRVSLRAHSGQFVVAEEGGGREVRANRNAVGAWERFQVIDRGNNRVALRTSSGHYLVAEGGGGREVAADRTRIDIWETFEVVSVGGNRIALRTHNGQYLMAQNGGGSGITATHGNLGAWETFHFARA